jgi:hypothetical protein
LTPGKGGGTITRSTEESFLPASEDDTTVGGRGFGGEVTGTVRAGRFVLEVGSYAGTRAYFTPDQPGDSTGLRVALDQAPSPGYEDGLEAAEGALEETASVTSKVERGLELFTALAQGRVFDRQVLQKEIDALLGTLERLDKQGRYREALRLARVLSGVLALGSRWVSLVDTLRIALRAARALGDAPGVAWARHELGTLALGAEDAAAANGQLTEALKLREGLGDERGAETTRHNLAVLRQAFGRGGGGKALLVAAVIGGVLLLAALGALVAMTVLDDEEEPPLVDTVAPAVEITEGPENPTEETSATFEFEADEDVRRFQCRLDDGEFEQCVSPQNFPGPLAPGPHVFAVRAVDFAGNRGDAASYEWTIEEGVGPTVTIVEAPAPLTNETTATFRLEASGAVRFQCRLDGGDFEECPNLVAYDDLGEGEHTFVARAFDAQERRGPPARHGWTVDTTAPVVEIGDLEFPEATTVRAPFTVDESGSIAQCALVTIDDPQLPEEEQEREEVARDDDCETPFTYEELEPDTNYAVVITATDPAGNESEPAEEQFDTIIVE